MKRSIPSVVVAVIVSQVAVAQYCDGYVWNRAADMAPGTAAGYAWARGNPGTDSVGAPVWSVEWVEGAGLDGASADQWYKQSPTLMVWDDNYFSTSSGCWVRGDDMNPAAGLGWQLHGRWVTSWSHIPLSRWTNLVGDGVTVDVTGSVDVRWDSQTSPANLSVGVDVVIAKFDVSAGAYTILHSETNVNKLLPTTTPETRTFTVNCTGVSLDLGDQIIITHRNRQPNGGMDPVSSTSLFDGDLDIIYRGRTFHCRLADFNGDGQINSTDQAMLLAVWGSCACP